MPDGMSRTILTAALVARRRVQFHFRGSGGGARNWREIVDGMKDLIDELADVTGHQADVGGGLLGQGARVELSIAAYAWLRTKFVRQRHVIAARAAGELELIEAPQIDAQIKRVFARIRSRGGARRNE